MAFQDVYFSGQGVVYVASRSGNNILAYRDVGNVPTIRVSMETDTVEHKESRTGQRLSDFRLTRENKANITMTLEKFTKANLQMLLYGSDQSTTTSTSVSGEILATERMNLKVGDTLFTKLPNVSSPVFSPSLTSPTDYSIDLTTGRITINAITAFSSSGTLAIAYSSAAHESVTMFKAPNVERAIRIQGVNTANSNAPVTLELYRVIFDPIANLDLIGDELGQFEVQGTVLFDTTRDTDAALGGFGRILQ